VRVEFAEGFHEDLERIRGPLVANGARVAARLEEIFEALRLLGHSPYIGQGVEGGLRQLVIGDRRRNRGYVALYDVFDTVDPEADDAGLVIVNAIRSWHEGGYH